MKIELYVNGDIVKTQKVDLSVNDHLSFRFRVTENELLIENVKKAMLAVAGAESFNYHFVLVAFSKVDRPENRISNHFRFRPREEKKRIVLHPPDIEEPKAKEPMVRPEATYSNQSAIDKYLKAS